MKVSVVGCDCGNTLPHKKYETADGRRSPGFNSIAQGIRVLDKAYAKGLEQTEDEKAATIAELNACGLRYEQMTEDELITATANELFKLPPVEQRHIIVSWVLSGSLSIDVADKIVNKLGTLEPLEPQQSCN